MINLEMKFRSKQISQQVIIFSQNKYLNHNLNKINKFELENFICIEIVEDTVEGKPFLKSEYNKDGDSYRSPWTNQYFPPIEI